LTETGYRGFLDSSAWQPVDELTRTRIGLLRPGSRLPISTILSIVSMKSPSTNLDENDSILALREFIHRLLATQSSSVFQGE